jgi:hypothetical protein
MVCSTICHLTLQEFDRNYTEIADANKAHYNTYFTAVGTSPVSTEAHLLVAQQHALDGKGLSLTVTVLIVQVRDLQNNFFAALTQAAMAMYEKYNQVCMGQCSAMLKVDEPMPEH